MEKALEIMGVSQKDLAKLSKIVEQFEGESLSFMLAIAVQRIENITVSHGIALGYLVGYLNATDETCSKYQKSLSLCQRQN